MSDTTPPKPPEGFPLEEFTKHVLPMPKPLPPGHITREVMRDAGVLPDGARTANEVWDQATGTPPAPMICIKCGKPDEGRMMLKASPDTWVHSDCCPRTLEPLSPVVEYSPGFKSPPIARRAEPCDVCWTDSWEPCPENTPGAMQWGRGWMHCAHCALRDEYLKLRDEVTKERLALDFLSDAKHRVIYTILDDGRCQTRFHDGNRKTFSNLREAIAAHLAKKNLQPDANKT